MLTDEVNDVPGRPRVQGAQHLQPVIVKSLEAERGLLVHAGQLQELKQGSSRLHCVGAGPVELLAP